MNLIIFIIILMNVYVYTYIQGILIHGQIARNLKENMKTLLGELKRRKKERKM